jgi:hypothetical protein
VKYWAYLGLKSLGVVGIMFGCMEALAHFYPPPPLPLPGFGPPPPLFLHDLLFTFLTFGIWLVGAGLFSLVIRDQSRRCRTCLRPLIMPVHSGSWGNMVIFGRPRTEWICPYGHGTLSIEQLQITGKQLPDWQPHDDDIWKELESYYQARK